MLLVDRARGKDSPPVKKTERNTQLLNIPEVLSRRGQYFNLICLLSYVFRFRWTAARNHVVKCSTFCMPGAYSWTGVVPSPLVVRGCVKWVTSLIWQSSEQRCIVLHKNRLLAQHWLNSGPTPLALAQNSANAVSTLSLSCEGNAVTVGTWDILFSLDVFGWNYLQACLWPSYMLIFVDI